MEQRLSSYLGDSELYGRSVEIMENVFSLEVEEMASETAMKSFIRAISDLADKPVLVHCDLDNRVLEYSHGNLEITIAFPEDNCVEFYSNCYATRPDSSSDGIDAKDCLALIASNAVFRSIVMCLWQATNPSLQLAEIL